MAVGEVDDREGVERLPLVATLQSSRIEGANAKAVGVDDERAIPRSLSKAKEERGVRGMDAHFVAHAAQLIFQDCKSSRVAVEALKGSFFKDSGAELEDGVSVGAEGPVVKSEEAEGVEPGALGEVEGGLEAGLLAAEGEVAGDYLEEFWENFLINLGESGGADGGLTSGMRKGSKCLAGREEAGNG